MADSSAIVSLVKIQLSTSASVITEDGLAAAVDSAVSELGWALPTTDSTRILWITKRALRHACFILWVASAQKFKYKQVNLQHRFEHYEKLIANMDTEFEKALSSNTNLFTGVESYKMFGTAVGAGFRYDAIGRDITYEDLLNFINVGD